MKIQRRQFLHLAAGAAALPAVPHIARAQAYPTRPITMFVLWPGFIADVVGRMIAEPMCAFLAQPIMIVNVRPDGGGRVERAVRAPGDGYTLIIGDEMISRAPRGALYSPWELTDLEPIAPLVSEPLMIVGLKDMPAQDLKELIAWLKANPDKASQGTGPFDDTDFLTGVSFQRETNTRFHLVPWAVEDWWPHPIDLEMGSAPNYVLQDYAGFLQRVRAGTLKPYAITGKTRLAVAPGIPTVDEAGLPGFYRSKWIGLWLPKGAPKDVIATLNAAVQAALAEPSLRTGITELGREIFPREQQTPDGLDAEIEKWRPIIKAAGIKDA